MKPRITVITITYNSAATLEETIRSVTMQDYPALEYVIIDGGSTDGTLDIVQKYKDQIQVVVSEPDKGISDAFNKGVTRATGEIIGIINSDDILLPGALQKLAEAYDPRVDVYSGLILFSTPMTSCSPGLYRNWRRLMILGWMCTAVLSSSGMRRQGRRSRVILT